MLACILAASLGVDAAEIRTGATAHVRANAIWFEDAAKLTEWQRLKQSGDAAAFSSYESNALGAREAWQFINELTVKILGYEPKSNQVTVEMTTPGRLVGTRWVLDARDLLP